MILDKEETSEKEGTVENCVLIEPVYIGPDARVVDSVLGPYAAIHGGAEVTNSVLKNTIVFADAHISNSALDDAVVGHSAEVARFAGSLNIGDHATAGAVEGS